MLHPRSFASALSVLILLLAPAAVAQQFAWDRVEFGGGGFVTGVFIHPTAPDLIYATSDTGKIYRWDEAASSWINIADNIPIRFGGTGYSIALDPSDPDAVYFLLKSKRQDIEPIGGIYKSTSRGDAGSWTKVLDYDVQGERWHGPQIAVDPLNSNIVYYGSTNSGLLRSSNAASAPGSISFSTVSGVPAPANKYGVNAVVFDARDHTADRTDLIYAAVWDQGIYRSTDGGQSFSLMNGSPKRAIHIALTGAVGEIVAVTSPADNSSSTNDGGIYRFNGSNWSQPVPSGSTFRGLASDPNNPDKLIAAISQGNRSAHYVSNDGGKSWSIRNYGGGAIYTAGDAPWVNNGRYPSTSPPSFAFDPHHPGDVWFADMYGVWRTSNAGPSQSPWPTQVQWRSQFQGIENTVGATLAAPWKGPALLFAGLHDVGGFRSTDLEDEPDHLKTVGVWPNDGSPHVSDVAYQWDDPLNVALVKSVVSWKWKPDAVQIAGLYSAPAVIVSDDGGETWRNRGAPFDHTIPVGAAKIAIAHNDPNKAVYVAYGQVPQWTDNLMADDPIRWRAAAGAPPKSHRYSRIYEYMFPIAADKVHDDTFYLWVFDDSKRPSSPTGYVFAAGDVYRSTDGGRSWVLPASQGFVPGLEMPRGYVAPGMWDQHHNIVVDTTGPTADSPEGEVWISGGDQGLWRSTNMADTFSRVDAVQSAYSFAFGKGNGNGNPALYIAGIIDDVRGVFLSTDLGDSWLRIDPEYWALAIDHRGVILEGDYREFGRVYVATQMGVAYTTLSVPEPQTLAALAVPACWLAQRRRRTAARTR